jgi:hypothetical protein
VEHPHHAQLSAHEARVTGQVLYRFCRGTEEQIVNELLMAAGHSSAVFDDMPSSVLIRCNLLA